MIIDSLEVTVSGWKVCCTDCAFLVPFGCDDKFLGLICKGICPVGYHIRPLSNNFSVVRDFELW